MRRLASFLFLSALFAGSLTAATAGEAGAAATTCSGFVQNKTIYANVTVNSGATCELFNVTITGNLTAQPGSSLFLDAPVHILGNLQATNLAHSGCSGAPRVVQIDGTLSVTGGVFQLCDDWTIRNNVYLTQLTSSPFLTDGGCECEEFADPADVHVSGNFYFVNNADKFGELFNWTVGGAGYINNNGGGVMTITNSTFGGILYCTGNTTGFAGGEVDSASNAGPNGNGLYGQCSNLGGGGSLPP